MKKFTHPLSNAAAGYIAKLDTKIKQLEKVAVDYRKHIDNDCAASGCLCTFPGKPACSEWITKILEDELQ